MRNVYWGWFLASLAVNALWLTPGTAAIAAQDSPVLLLQQLDEFPHAKQVSYSREQVLDYELGLGAMQKVRGVWQLKDSERLSGTLTRYTWQIIDGFSSLEVMQELARDDGMTMMVVTHEMGFARRVADRVIFMDEGEIVEDANTEDFFGTPRSDRAQLFLSKILEH